MRPRAGQCVGGRGGLLLNMDGAFASLSVIVPVGRGDGMSPVLRAQLAQLPRAVELHVVCANADDAARMQAAVPAHAGPQWRCLVAPPGRAAQQNAGARAATGRWLWFLHADSELAANTLPRLAAFLRRDESALGFFDLRFLDDGPALMPLNMLGAWLRSRWLGLPFGDQGLLLPRARFEQLGGFDTALHSGEDHDLVWRARRAGLPLRPLRATLYTSARKYAERGWWRTTGTHLGETWRQARRFSRTAASR